MSLEPAENSGELDHRGTAIDVELTAGNARRDDPHVDQPPSRPAGDGRAPLAHVEIMADDAGAGAHLLEDPGTQPEIDLGSEIEGEHVRFGERRLEQILAAEFDEMGDPAAWALAFASLIRAGSISTPSPRAPWLRAAAIRMRPSPEPRSMT